MDDLAIDCFFNIGFEHSLVIWISLLAQGLYQDRVRFYLVYTEGKHELEFKVSKSLQ